MRISPWSRDTISYRTICSPAVNKFYRGVKEFYIFVTIVTGQCIE